MRELKNEKIREAIKHAAAEFFERESNRVSLITITGVRLAGKGTRATILCTVLPEKMEREALAFLRRQRGALRNYIGEHIKIQRLPTINCELDPIRNLYAINLGDSNNINNTKE